MYLSECCLERKVHLIVRRKLGPSISEYLLGRIHVADNIVLHEGVEIAEVHGEHRLETITLRADDQSNTEKQNAEETIPVSAVFIFIGSDPKCF